MAYVDGFLIAVPKDKLDIYKEMSRQCMAIWKELGAIDYVETVGDDVPYGKVTSFPRAVQATDDEVVVFSWIVYPDRRRETNWAKDNDRSAPEGDHGKPALRRQAHDLWRFHAVPGTVKN